ncbi:MAG TPA: Ni/Fe hydrogenase subunit alpha [Dissulfurispiraceae bacterium]|nr:Ni/Fe hydrogenase subunit alpha [Dissulfurispiraceae bacterium]
MSKMITINPVTRIEGHGKVSLIRDEQGKLSDVRFCVQEFRGFEKFCKGALAESLPSMTSRICGVCPVPHSLASIKAIEDCFGTVITPTAKKLRELHTMGQFIESHMLSLAVLSLPDLAARDSKPEQRNVIGLYQANKEAVKKALEIRSFGTAICSIVGRSPVHPIGARIGGVVLPVSSAEAGILSAQAEEMKPSIAWLSHLMRVLFEKNADYIDELGDIQTSYFGLTENGTLAFYDGDIRVIREDGSDLARFKPAAYFDYVEEKIENWSYMKFPVLKSGERFRVGPLARVNIADQIPTPMASKELEWFRAKWPRPAHKTLCYHFARFIELVFAFERAEELLRDPDIIGQDIFVKPEIKAGIGIGVVEAPRGTLVHRYELDEEGKASNVDIFVATQHNNYGYNDALKETAMKLVGTGDPDESTQNKLEMIVRAYDPCLSCATHAIGKSGWIFESIDCNGKVTKEWCR